jgi:branched-subunit amino acid transport protein
MGFIASLIGSGAGVVIIGATFIAMMHVGRLPEVAQKILKRLFILAMYAGGSALAVTELGTLWMNIASRIADLFGGLGTGIPRTVIVLLALMLLLGTVVSLAFAPNDAAILTAAFLPAVLMLVPGGFLHQVYVGTTIPAQAMADSFNAWIAG